MVKSKGVKEIFDKYDFKKTVIVGLLFGAIGLLWFYYSGIWTDPSEVDIFEWTIFIIYCFISVICWYLVSKKKLT